MPSKPAGNSNQQTTSQTTVSLPNWLDVGAATAFGQAQGTADNLAPPTQLQIAGLTPGMQDTFSWLRGLQGYGQGGFQSAQNVAQNVSQYQPQQVGPDPALLQRYMNPFTASVIQPAMTMFDQSNAQALNQVADQAAKTGAFAGSRQGVLEGAQGAQNNLLKSQFLGQLNMADYSQAMQAAQQAQLANQNAGLQGAALNLNAATGAGNLLTQGQQSALTGANAAIGAGQAEMANQQAQYQSAQDYANAMAQYPVNKLQVLLAALQGTNLGQRTQTTVGTGAGPTSNPFLTGLGGLAAGTGIAGNIMGLLGAIPTGGASLAIPAAASIGGAVLSGAGRS